MSELSTSRLFKKKDVAAILACSTKHVDLLIKQGKLACIMLGPNTKRITSQSLYTFISGK